MEIETVNGKNTRKNYLRLFLEGKDNLEVAQLLGVSREAARKTRGLLRRSGDLPPSTRQYRPPKHLAKVEDKEIKAEFKRRIDAGKWTGPRELARDMKLTLKRIQTVLSEAGLTNTLGHRYQRDGKISGGTPQEDKAVKLEAVNWQGVKITVYGEDQDREACERHMAALCEVRA